MLKHKTHFGETLSLNWQASLGVDTRILVGKGAIAKLSDLLSQLDTGNKILLLKQANLFGQQIDQLKMFLQAKDIAVHILELPDGEICKSTEHLIDIWNALHQWQFSRKDTLVAIGGGVITDIAGFAASTYLRGINLITIPTTLLAQVDAAIGGKTAVNFRSGKNLIGNYYFAKAVIVDTELLSTLPRNQFVSGLAEIIKYALLEKTIANEAEYHMGPKSLLYVLENSIANLNWSDELLPGILIASIKMKLAVVAKDPQENGLRRCLNLGHTLGHALESVSNFTLSHGEAVSIGIAYAVYLAESYKQIDQMATGKALELLIAAGLPVKMPVNTQISPLLDYIFRDKKREGESIKMILPTCELGAVSYSQLIKRDEIEKRLYEFANS
jgi:3-dehydroquinate synthase